MPLVRIVTDSSACLPDKAVGHPNLRVVPIWLRTAEGKVADGHDAEPVVRRSWAEGVQVTTVAPSAIDYLGAIDDMEPDPRGHGRSTPTGTVIVTPAARLAIMHRNAVLAARLANRAIRVVDSRTAAGGHGLAVMAALDAAEAGADVDQVAAAVVQRLHHIAMVAAVSADTGPGTGTELLADRAGSPPLRHLGHLERTGAPARVVRLADGSITELAPDARTTVGTGRVGAGADAAAFQMAEAWRGGGGPDAERGIIFYGSHGDAEAERLAALLHSPFDLVPAGPALSLHVGPGCVGVAWLRANTPPRP